MSKASSSMRPALEDATPDDDDVLGVLRAMNRHYASNTKAIAHNDVRAAVKIMRGTDAAGALAIEALDMYRRSIPNSDGNLRDASIMAMRTATAELDWTAQPKPSAAPGVLAMSQLLVRQLAPTPENRAYWRGIAAEPVVAPVAAPIGNPLVALKSVSDTFLAKDRDLLLGLVGRLHQDVVDGKASVKGIANVFTGLAIPEDDGDAADSAKRSLSFYRESKNKALTADQQQGKLDSAILRMGRAMQSITAAPALYDAAIRRDQRKQATVQDHLVIAFTRRSKLRDEFLDATYPIFGPRQDKFAVRNDEIVEAFRTDGLQGVKDLATKLAKALGFGSSAAKATPSASAGLPGRFAQPKLPPPGSRLVTELLRKQKPSSRYVN